jgi:uridine phosphorylase
MPNVGCKRDTKYFMNYITPTGVMKERFSKNPKPLWDSAILCFRDFTGSQHICSELKAVPLGYKVLWGMEEFADNPLAHEIELGDAHIGVVARCQWGGPQAAIFVEELAQIGVQFILGVGAAGSLKAELPRGSQMIAASVLCTDGTSRAYCSEPTLGAPKELLAAATAAGRKTGIELQEVTLATTDAIYRETDDQVRDWLRLGAHAVCMEAAPLLASARRCGIRCLWVGHVSDCLVARQWEPWLNLEEMTRATARIAKAIVQDQAEEDV